MSKTGKPSNISFEQAANASAVGRKAAMLVAELLLKKPDAAIVFPTGSTPLPMYEHLRHMPHLPWRNARLFHLDEYVPPAGYRGPVRYETYEEYMRRELWDMIGARKHYFRHYAADPAAYERLVAENGGPDLVILGIGANGHIAFNEPSSTPDSPARTVDLAPETILSNFRSTGKVGYPTQAVTLGLGAILSARHIILLATGENKRDIVQKAFDPAEPPSAELPASWLKTHPNVTVITDFPIS